MTAPEAAAAMARGVAVAVPEAECTLIPMADGGEGTTDDPDRGPRAPCDAT